MSRLILLLLFTGVFSSCEKKTGSTSPAPVVSVPGHFPAMSANPDNPMTISGVALGRMLFYDTRLSGNNKLSCASCHNPSIAFTDGLALSSLGASRKKLSRSAPALINMAWATNGLFWDGGATNLESQAFGPLTSEDEMYQNLAELVAELKEVPAYVKSFKTAFNGDITTANIVKAIAQYERTLISGDSKYDRHILNGAALTSEENTGMILFNTHCRSCHAGELFTDNAYHNNGIDGDFSNDTLEGIYQGRYRISYAAADMGKFKTPTLRNIALTAPYMHDGRFSDLTAVLQHYSTGIKVSSTTDTLLLATKPLSAAAQTAIIAFLHTLTDSTFIHDSSLSRPELP